MNRSQRRLHSHRRRPAARELRATPALGRDVTPVADGDRARFSLVRDGFAATVSIPARPAGWVVLAAGESESPALGHDYAILRVERPPGRDWSDALTRAARWLSALPEARGLRIAIVGAGPGREAALAATAKLGPRVSALLLDAAAPGPIVLTPTLVARPDDAERIAAFLGAELGGAPPCELNHRQRRVLARRVERRLRRDCRRRGALTGRVRAGIATLAAALAFTLALGVAAQPASATFIPNHDPNNLSLSITDDDTPTGNGVTLECDGALPTDQVLFDDGGGSTTLPGPGVGGQLDCNEVSSLTADAGSGNDTVDLSGVSGTQFINLTGGDVTATGGPGVDSVTGTGVRDLLQGGNGADTLLGGGDGDSLRGGGQNDSMNGQGDSDTVDFSNFAGPVTVDLGTSVATGHGTDTVVAENAIGTDAADSLTAGGAISSLVGAVGADTLTGAGSADTLVGGNDGDTLNGLGGIDSLLGDAGDDALSGGAANDSVNGGADTDLLDFSGEASGVGVDLAAGSATGGSIGTDTVSAVEQADGSAHEDTLEGSNAADTLRGLGLGDTIVATGDTVGGAGDDSLDGGNGADTIDTRLSADAFGGNGDDTLSFVPTTGSGSPQTFDGGATGETTGDILIGSVTGDSDRDLALSDTVLTGQGTDDIVSIERASLAGDNSDNLLTTRDALGNPFSGEVTLVGMQGDDTLGSAGGDDVLAGGTGGETVGDQISQLVDGDQDLDDTLLTGTGTDTVSGFEQANLSQDPAVGDTIGYVIDATGFTAGPTTLAGGFEDDTLLGSGQTDTLDGSAGDDSLTANGADDLIQPDNGVDVAEGGAGNNTVEYSNATGPVEVNLADGEATKSGFSVDALSGIQNAIGSLLDDTLSGDDGDNVLDGNTGSDRVTQAVDDQNQTLTDTLLTGDGTDTLAAIEAASLTGGALNNVLDVGGSTFGSVSLDGGAGNDDVADYGDAASSVDLDLAAGTAQYGVSSHELAGIENATGSPQGDTLVGEGGPNSLDGAAGNDVLRGGGDDDALVGGAGNNTADYSDAPGPNGINANLVTGVVLNASTDSLTDVQNLIGSPFDDTLTGSAAVNTLAGAAGNDVHNTQGGGVDQNLCGVGTADVANADAQDTNIDCETVNTPPAGGGGGGGTPPPADTQPPILTLSGDAKQKSKKVKVDAACDEACSVDAGGTIKVPMIKQAKGATAAKKKTYDLPVASVDVAAGASETLTLKPTGKAKKALKKALKAGKKSTANLSATAADAAGNQGSDEFKVKVKKKRKK